MTSANETDATDVTVLGSETVAVEEAGDGGVEIPLNDAVVDVLGLTGDETVDIEVSVTVEGEVIINADLPDVDVSEDQLNELEIALNNELS